MATITAKLTNKLITEAETTINIIEATNPRVHFVQNQTCTAAGIGIQDYGVAMIPDDLASETPYILEAVLNGKHYYAAQAAVEALDPGDTLTMSDTIPT